MVDLSYCSGYRSLRKELVNRRSCNCSLFMLLLSLTAVANRYVIVSGVRLFAKEMVPELSIDVVHTVPLVGGVVTVGRAIAVQALRYTLSCHIALEVANWTNTVHLRRELQYLVHPSPRRTTSQWNRQQPKMPKFTNQDQETFRSLFANKRNCAKINLHH